MTIYHFFLQNGGHRHLGFIWRMGPCTKSNIWLESTQQLWLYEGFNILSIWLGNIYSCNQNKGIWPQKWAAPKRHTFCEKIWQSLKKIAGEKCKICAEFVRKLRWKCAQLAQVARKLSWKIRWKSAKVVCKCFTVLFKKYSMVTVIQPSSLYN